MSERSNIQLQYDIQTALMDKSFEQNMQATRDERAYNTPSAQLARLRAAGLNPLYYGLDGNSSNGAPFTMSTPQADVAGPANAAIAKMQLIQGGIQQLISASKNMAEVNRMAAETDLIKHQTQKTAVDTALGKQDLQIKPAEFGLRLRIGQSEIEVNESKSKVNDKQLDVLAQAYKNAQEEFFKIQQEKHESQSREELNYAQIPVLKSQQVLNGVMADTERAKQENIRAATEKLKADTQNSYEDLFSKQIKNGYLPKQMLIELGVLGQSFERQQVEIENLKKYGKLLDTQDTNMKVRLFFDGLPLNCWKDENGVIQFDKGGAIDYWKNLNRAEQLQKYARIYQTISSGVESNLNSYNSFVGANANALRSIVPFLGGM